MQVSCPHCGQPISCDDSWAGQNTECPSCKQPLTLPARAAAEPDDPLVPKVPEGGSGIWLITYSSNVTVSGAVTLCRTNIVMGGSGLQANQANPTSSFEPHGGTNDGYSGCWMGALQAGETFHVTFNCVGGTSATFTMIHFSAYRIDAIPASQPFQNR